MSPTNTPEPLNQLMDKLLDQFWVKAIERFPLGAGNFEQDQLKRHGYVAALVDIWVNERTKELQSNAER